MAKSKLVAVDGTNVTLALWHTTKGERTSNNRPKGMVSAFVSYLFRIMEEYAPDIVVIFFDALLDNNGAMTWRREVYPSYKANRVRSDEDKKAFTQEYVPQFKALLHFLRCAGIPHIAPDSAGLSKAEADDLIALLATSEVIQSECDMIIHSTDKDMRQLARWGSCRIASPFDKEGKIYHQPKENGPLCCGPLVEAPSPETYLFMRAIIGDSSDNVQGIPGVGEKTVQANVVEPIMPREKLYAYISRCAPMWREDKRMQRVLMPESIKTIYRNVALLGLIPPHRNIGFRYYGKCKQGRKYTVETAVYRLLYSLRGKRVDKPDDWFRRFAVSYELPEWDRLPMLWQKQYALHSLSIESAKMLYLLEKGCLTAKRETDKGG